MANFYFICDMTIDLVNTVCILIYTLFVFAVWNSIFDQITQIAHNLFDSTIKESLPLALNKQLFEILTY